MRFPSSHMASEIAEIPAAVARLADPASRALSRSVAAQLRALDPPALLTVARGSSDHAASYLSYAAQMVLRRPVASVGPSIASVYGTALQSSGLAALAISQSGGSSDIVALTKSLSDQGGFVLALTNTPTSALEQAAGATIDVLAGPERAVAATKSFYSSIVAGLWLLADWANDDAMADALHRLPDAMAMALEHVPQDQIEALLSDAKQAVVLGRGPGLGLAQEVALKLIETCEIHASAYSGAEVLHGPSALLVDGFPVLALQTGAAQGMEQCLPRIRSQGARVIALPEHSLTGHPLVDPLLDLQGLYQTIETLTRRRGLDPDNPPNLQKVTKTV